MRSTSALKQAASVIAGVLVIGLIIGFFTTPVEMIKWLGAPLLVLPSALGLMPTVTPGEIQTLSLYQNAPVVRVAEAGPYAIYTDDRNVLSRANMLEGAGTSWMRIELTPTRSNAAQIKVAPVLRGARPYDPVWVRGRPILTFELPEAGDYVLVYPPQSGIISFAPDTVTGREITIVIMMAIQLLAIGAVVLLVRWPRLRRTEQQRRQLAEKLARKRVKDEEFWQNYEQDHTQSQ